MELASSHFSVERKTPQKHNDVELLKIRKKSTAIFEAFFFFCLKSCGSVEKVWNFATRHNYALDYVLQLLGQVVNKCLIETARRQRLKIEEAWSTFTSMFFIISAIVKPNVVHV